MRRSWIACSMLASTMALAGCEMLNPAFEDGGDSVADDSGSDESESGSGTSSTDDDATSSGTSDSTTDPDTSDSNTLDATSDTGPECMDGQLACDGGCVDASDPANCGMCGMECGVDQLCVSASCVPLKRVFVTSVPFAANLSGIQGADQFCKQIALSAQLAGEFKAWISTPNSFPAQSFSHEGAYMTTGGVLVAKSWGDLIDGQLEAPINVDQYGDLLSSNEACGATTAVWTATTPDGLFAPGGNCSDWTIGSVGANSRVGDAFATDAAWSQIGDCFISCAAPLGLYCFQQ